MKIIQKVVSTLALVAFIVASSVSASVIEVVPTAQLSDKFSAGWDSLGGLSVERIGDESYNVSFTHEGQTLLYQFSGWIYPERRIAFLEDVVEIWNKDVKGPIEWGPDISYFVSLWGPGAVEWDGTKIGPSETLVDRTPDQTSWLNLTIPIGSIVRVDAVSIRPTAVPEPATYASVAGLLLFGGAILLRRRHKRST